MNTLFIDVPHKPYMLIDENNDQHYFEFFCLFNQHLNKAMTVVKEVQYGDGSNSSAYIASENEGIKNSLNAQELTKSLSKRTMIEKMEANSELKLRYMITYMDMTNTHYITEESAKRAIGELFPSVQIEIFKFLFDDKSYESYEGVMATW